jgi:hypothetical protein
MRPPPLHLALRGEVRDHGALDTSECSADREDDERDIVLISSHYGVVVDWLITSIA